MSEDKQYDFYVAGPFFDPEQTASMERLEKETRFPDENVIGENEIGSSGLLKVFVGEAFDCSRQPNEDRKVRQRRCAQGGLGGCTQGYRDLLGVVGRFDRGRRSDDRRNHCEREDEC